MAKKITKKLVKSTNARTGKNIKTITVKNADGEPDTTAKILVQNKISYTPKVSVIIPVYNVEKYLRECLDSVVNQTLREIEIICVDDGSTDSSLDILKEYASKDNRITVITQQNLHAGVARNAGLSVAKGKTIHFLDSDDFVDNTFYATLFKNLESYNADFAYCSWTMKTENDLAPRNMGNTEVQFLGLHAFDNDKDKVNVEVWNKLFRKHIIEEYNIRFPKSNYGEDVAFVMQYLFLSKNCFGINDPMYIYRVQPNSMMSSILNKKLDSYKASSYVLSFLNKHSELKNDNSFYFKKLENSLKWLGCLSGTPQEALNYIHSFKNYVVDKIDTSNIPSGTLLEKLKNEKYQFVFDTLFPEFRDYKKNKRYYDLQYTGTLDKKQTKNLDVINNTVDIAFIMDADYFLCSYIAITSMIKSKNKTTCYNINVIHTNLSLRQIKILSLLENSDVHINIIGFNASKYNFVKKLMHITNTALIKFDIPNIFPNLDKILYIDGDILVQKDLSDLFNIDLQENYIAASKEMQASLWHYERIVGSQYYINSGVLLFNLKKMRTDNVPQKMIDKKMNQPDTWKCMDQDVFNNICDGKIHFLDVAYNCTISIFLKRGWTIQEINKFYGTKYRSIEDLIKKSTILHFAGDYKPWEYNVKAGKITKKYMDVLNHSLMNYKISNYKNLKQVVTLERGLRYKRELLQWYKKVTGKKLDLNNPQTFNEKIQWLKLYDSTPIKTLLADKYLVRDWVAEKIGEKYLIPLLGVYDSFDEIDFDKLPNQFVLKTNHGSGWNAVITDKSKMDVRVLKEKFDRWMATNFAFVAGCELHYLNIKPKIIIEKYVSNDGKALWDYKFWCFNGKVKYMQFRDDFSRDLKMVFYDMKWHKQPFYYDHPLYDKELEKPDNFDEMVKIAEKLCQDFAFVCVDLYRLNNGEIKFGEMTFTRSSGCGKWNDYKYDEMLGNFIKLPKLAYEIETGEYYKLPKQSKNKTQHKPSIIKPYLLLPYYLIYNFYLKTKIIKLTGACKRIQDLPVINVDEVISLGHNCQAAYRLQKFGFRKCSLPFDWMMSYDLNVVIDTLKNRKLDWFSSFTEEPWPSKKFHRVKDNVTQMISLLHFPLEYSIKDYLPVFNSIFYRRKERLHKILSNSHDICFMMNRTSDIKTILDFLQKISDMYNNTHFTIINIRSNVSDKGFYRYKLNKKCVLYDIHDSNISELGADPLKNPVHWIGNTQLWTYLLSKIHLKSSNNDTVSNDIADTYIKETNEKLNLLNDLIKQVNNNIAGVKQNSEKQISGLSDTYVKMLNKINQQSDNIKNIESSILNINNQTSETQELFDSKLAETQKLFESKASETQELFDSKISESNNRLSEIQNEFMADIDTLSEQIDTKASDLYEKIDKVSESFGKQSVVFQNQISDNFKVISERLNDSEKTLSDKITNVIDAKHKELSDNITKTAAAQNTDTKRIENAVVDVKNQMLTFEKNSLNSVNNVVSKLDSNKQELNTNIEKDRILYFNPWSTAVNTERGNCDMTSAPDFENRFKKLIAGLSAESAETVVKIIRRLQLIKGTNSKLDLFTKEEKDLLQRARDFNKEILKVSDNLYAYKNYLLPINHFEASVFLYNHGIEKLNSVESFKDKDILDVGGFIGDSVLMLSPLTNKKIYSFEAIKENFDLMQKTIELNGIKNAVPVHTAVGDKPGELELRFNGSASSQNDIMVKNPKYVEKCPVITIDDYVREHNLNVGLIKVDIEGAEQSFLRGAYETIRTQKPTLLISIYHNVDDFLDIKPLIESWNLGYKFKVFKPVIESVSGETLLICEQ